MDTCYLWKPIQDIGRSLQQRKKKNGGPKYNNTHTKVTAPKLHLSLPNDTVWCAICGGDWRVNNTHSWRALNKGQFFGEAYRRHYGHKTTRGAQQRITCDKETQQQRWLDPHPPTHTFSQHFNGLLNKQKSLANISSPRKMNTHGNWKLFPGIPWNTSTPQPTAQCYSYNGRSNALRPYFVFCSKSSHWLLLANRQYLYSSWRPVFSSMEGSVECNVHDCTLYAGIQTCTHGATGKNK